MNWKRAALAVAALAALSLGGCSASPEFSGTVDEAVEYCQSLEAGESPIIEVTGYLDQEILPPSVGKRDNGDTILGFMMFDDEGECYVNVAALNPDEETIAESKEAMRCTATGKALEIGPEGFSLAEATIEFE